MTPAAPSTFDPALIWLISGWAAVALGAALLLWALFRDRSRGRRRCPKCWYDMKGVPGLRCPECGREAKRESRFYKTRRRWRWALVALLLAAAGFTSTRVPKVLKDGIIASVPTPALRFTAWTHRARAKELFEDLMRPVSTSDAQASSARITFAVPMVRTLRGGKATSLSEWEKVIVAWHAGRVLLEPTTPNPARFNGVTRRGTAAECVRAAGANGRVAVPDLELAAVTGECEHALFGLRAVASAGDSGAIAALERFAVGSGDLALRIDAAVALVDARSAYPIHAYRVRRIIRRTVDVEIAAEIASALVRHSMSTRAPTAWAYAELIAMLEDDRSVFRLAVLRAVGLRSFDWSPLAPTLLPMLSEDSSPQVRAEIATRIRHGADLAPHWGLPLVRGCEHSDQELRSASTETLFVWSSRSSWPLGQFAVWLAERDTEAPLANGAHRDTMQWFRSLADAPLDNKGTALTIRRLHLFAPDHPELLPTYLGWARTHPLPAARAAAVETVAKFVMTTPETALELLAHIMQSDSNGWVRIVALRELPPLAPDEPRMLEFLADGLQDDERDVRMIAASILGVLARPHPRAEAALAALSNDADPALAQMAGSALVAIGLRQSDGSKVPWVTPSEVDHFEKLPR